MAIGLRTALVLLCDILLSAPPILAQEREHPAAGLPVPRSSLTLEERSRALEVAVPERRILSPLALSPEARRADAGPRVVVSRIEAVDSKDEGRRVLVTLYQYDGGVTIQRLVDLDVGRVLSEERAETTSAPLAQVERDYARALVLADERVARLLAPHPDVSLEFLLTLTTERDRELFGRRIAAALFRTPRGYLEQQVYVDLTAGRVFFRDR
jgi:hypothetical protein